LSSAAPESAAAKSATSEATSAESSAAEAITTAALKILEPLTVLSTAEPVLSFTV
jgi:hypothetical protein